MVTELEMGIPIETFFTELVIKVTKMIMVAETEMCFLGNGCGS